MNIGEKNKFYRLNLSAKISDLVDAGIFSVRSGNICRDYEIYNLQALRDFGSTVNDFLTMRNCGLKSAMEFMEVLESINATGDQEYSFAKLTPSAKAIFVDAHREYLAAPLISELSRDVFLSLFSDPCDLFTSLLYRELDIVAHPAFDRLDDAKTQYFEMEKILKFLLRLRLRIEHSASQCAELESIVHFLYGLEENFRARTAKDFVECVLPEELRLYMDVTLKRLLEAAPVRVRSLHRDMLRTLDKLFVYFPMNMGQFVSKFGGKRKSATDYYIKVLLPIREIYERISSGAVPVSQLVSEVKFPFLTEEEHKECVRFREAEGHYPLFKILFLYLRASPSREDDVLIRRFGVIRYPRPQSMDEIAYVYNLTRERVRQLVANNSLLKIEFMREPDWGRYVANVEGFITAKSECFTSMLEKEHVDCPFGFYAYILSSTLPFTMVDKPFPYLVREEYATSIATAIAKMEQNIKAKNPAPISIDVNMMIPSHSEEQDKVCKVIIDEVCPAMGVATEGRSLIFEQNHIDTALEIRNYLQACGAPRHIDRIKAYLEEKYPDAKFSAESLKHRMRERADIQSMGKTSMYKLAEWDHYYSGSIRDLLRELFEESEIPVSLDYLTDKVTRVFETTSRKSIHSSISGNDEFQPYENGLWGLAGKCYPPEYVKVDLSRLRLSFNERFAEFQGFVADNGRLPYSSPNEQEASLKRWQINVLKRMVEVTDEQAAELQAFLDANLHLPVTGYEAVFYENCKAYKAYVAEHGELPRSRSKLYFWFRKNKPIYEGYQDKRRNYFADLLSHLNSNGFPSC